VKPRFHCVRPTSGRRPARPGGVWQRPQASGKARETFGKVRQRTDLHDQLKLAGHAVLVLLM
jgi:hypothetical protein